MEGWIARNSNRYQREIAAIRKEFPYAQIVRAKNTSQYCPICHGTGSSEHLAVIANFTTQLGHSYLAIMVYPCDFPNRIPGVWPLRPLRLGTPHQYLDNRICLTANEYDSNITGAQVLGMAFGWFTCYDIWLIKGVFPPNNYGKHRV